MIKFVKKLLLRTKTAKNIADSYSTYFNFTSHATPHEKEVVIKDAVTRANELQREIVSSAHYTNSTHTHFN